MSDLFAAPITVEATEGKRSIPGATLVKNLAMQKATEIMAKIPSADAEFIEQVRDTQTNVAAMDAFVKEQCGASLNNPEVAEFDEEEAKKILKSNQSNRSRRKNQPMTQANYVDMLTSAIAEWIIRESCNITKSAGGFGAGRQALVIDDDTVARLADDQEALGRAIRNVQSKKSTYKAKHADNPDFEQDAEWQELLEQEAKLKAVRTTTPAGSRKGLSVKKALQFIFDGVAPTAELGKDESHAVIEACRELSQGVYPQEYVDMVMDQQAKKVEDETVYSD